LRLASERFYVPVDRLSTRRDGLTLDTLAAVWRGETPIGQDLRIIYPDEASMPDLVTLLGTPGPNSVRPLPLAQVARAVWSDPHSIGILPFEALTPRLRALRLDGLSITDNRLVPGSWLLARRSWLPAREQDWASPFVGPGATNRQPGSLTVLVMTATTALTRGTAAAIDRTRDPAWPARLVGPELAAADITTASNEVSFVDGCVTDNREAAMAFSAKPAYFASLALAGIDLVGLTGNHLNDFGRANFLKTLELYRARGIKVYGGGRDDRGAREPLIVKDHGNTLAFVGANSFGPPGAWAGPQAPGAATYDAVAMAGTLASLREQADVVFAELQFQETNAQGDYQVEPLPGQREAFRALLDSGADVVTGIQAHAPQSLELRGRGLILYGLGNLFFDQTWSWPTRTGLVPRYTIYDHRLINVELLVTVINDDMQLRWATLGERGQVLGSVFAASGW
jgi:hypothetical protein